MEAERTPEGVFGLLSDEIRVNILRTIALAQQEEQETGVAVLSFSDIYDRLDVDNTSKLSYHLGELTGTFLRKHDDGYAFTHAGERLIRFILAENYRSPDDFGTIELDGTCLFCGGRTLEASLEEQYFLVRCSDCDRPAFSYRIKPALVRAHSGGDLIDAVISEQTGDLLKMRERVCPDCAGRLDTDVVAAENGPVSDAVRASFAVNSTCQQCRRYLSIPLSYAAAYHPESLSFHWEHGVDIMGTGMWEWHTHLQAGRWYSERLDTEYAEYRVVLRIDETELRLFLDNHALVTRTERVQRRDQGGRRS